MCKWSSAHGFQERPHINLSLAKAASNHLRCHHHHHKHSDGPTDIATTDRPTDISDEAHHLGEIIGSIVAVVSGLIALAGAIYKNIEAVRRLLGQL